MFRAPHPGVARGGNDARPELVTRKEAVAEGSSGESKDAPGRVLGNNLEEAPLTSFAAPDATVPGKRIWRKSLLARAVATAGLEAACAELDWLLWKRTTWRKRRATA